MELVQNQAKKNGKGKISGLPAKDLEVIDTMLLNPNVTSTEVVDFIRERYGIEVTGPAIRFRRKKVRAENAVLEITAHEVIEDEVDKETGELKKEIEAGRALAKASFQTMKQSLAPIMGMDIEDFPESERGLYKTLKEKIGSALRRAEEFYQTVDYFGYLNYAINAQQLRVAKGMEMELTMPVTMTNVTNDLKLLVDMIEKAIKIAQSLGLAPMVAQGMINNGTMMFQTNQFSMTQNNTVNISERQRQMEQLKEAVKKLPPAKIDELKQKFLEGIRRGNRKEAGKDN